MSSMLLDDIFAPRTAKRGLIETSGQTTVYHIGDAADMVGRFIAKGPYYVLTAASDPAFPGGVFSGNVNLDVAHYAAATISFTAPGTVSDAAAGLATILTGDTVVIKGSGSNDGVYVVTGGGVAGSFTVAAGIVNEGAGVYISLYKRTTHSNNAVVDAATGLMWSRNTSTGEKVGAASTGALVWYDATKNCILHPVAADLSIVAPSILRIVGGAVEIARYHVGDVLKLAGFATAANNLPGWVVSSVTVNGADLDIELRILGTTVPTVEVAGGVRSISLVCQSIFNYAAAANTSLLSGYSDWRNPLVPELVSLMDIEVPDATPDVVSFPVWPTTVGVWAFTTVPNSITFSPRVIYSNGVVTGTGKNIAFLTELVRSV